MDHAHLFSENKGTLAKILREHGKETNFGEQGKWKFRKLLLGARPIIFRELGNIDTSERASKV